MHPNVARTWETIVAHADFPLRMTPAVMLLSVFRDPNVDRGDLERLGLCVFAGAFFAEIAFAPVARWLAVRETRDR